MINRNYDNIKDIKKKQKKLEKELKIKISIAGKDVSIEGEAEDEYIAEKVLDAIDFGFSVERALAIKKEDFSFEILDIRHYTKKKDLKRIRGRIIGTSGKTLGTLAQLTQCHFEVNDNRVGILGNPECIKNAQEAVILLVQGSKQANVYAFLERHYFHPAADLGLKEPKKAKKGKE
jgi:ribosomal RNA assembly protein